MLTKARITLIKSLADRKHRCRSGLFAAEGLKLVDELIRSELTVREVYGLPEALSELPPRAGMHEVSGREMERISHLKTASGVLALVEIPDHAWDPRAAAHNLVLALDDVQDPGNVGTIIRVADWFGIRDIICSRATADAFSPKVVQATMGAIARVRLHYVDLPDLLDDVRKRDVPVYGTFLEGGSIYQAPLGAEGIIVLGSEGKGVSPEVEKRITGKLFIPPYPTDVPTSESLNVAVAAAVVCSEFRRRNR